MPAQICLYVLLALAVSGIVFSRQYKVSIWIAWIQLGLSGFIFLFLANALLKGSFGYQYVFHNSEKALSTIYKISAIWSGDSGSLILWMLMVSVLVLVCARLGEMFRAATNTSYGLLFFIVLLVILGQPFKAVVPVPIDGMGLSPLLQNPWMVSHPLVVFASYALLAIPFGLTVQYLLKPSPQVQGEWRKNILQWVLGSWFFLGLGILLGAIWAYDTLGWGGYWGWDPVENSSLVPWLLLTVSVHALLIDEGTNNGSKAAASSILASFLTMIAAVFITRSGALSEMSVHTFSGSDLAFWIILAGFAVALGFSVFSMIKGWKLTPNTDQADWTSKPFTIGIANIATTVFAIAVLVGTFLPMFGGQSLSRIYYQTVMVPVASIMLLGAGIAPMQAWKATGLKQLVRKMILPLMIAAGTILTFPQNGDWLMLIVGLFACLVVGTNIVAMASVSIKKWGSYLSHIGLGLLAAGILVSSIVQDTKILPMTRGVQQDFFGFATKITSFAESQSGDTFSAQYEMNYKNEKIIGTVSGKWDRKASQWIMEPSINRSVQRDVIFVVSNMSEGQIFDMREAKISERNGYKLEVVAIDEKQAEVWITDGKEKMHLVAPYDEENPKPVTISPNLEVMYRGDGTFYLKDIRDDRPGTLKFSVSVSIRYWTFFLWLGGLVLLAGILWALFFRIFKPKRLALIGAVKVEAVQTW